MSCVDGAINYGLQRRYVIGEKIYFLPFNGSRQYCYSFSYTLVIYLVKCVGGAMLSIGLDRWPSVGIERRDIFNVY